MSSRRRLVLLATPLVVLAVAWFALWAPRSRAQADEQSRRDDLEVQVGLLRHRVDRAEEFEQEGGEQRLAAARAALPDDADLGGFVTQHEELARAAGVTVLSLAPAEAAEGSSRLDEVEITLSVLGERPRVLDYAARLSELSRLTEVKDISLTTEGDGRTSATIHAVIRHLSD